MNISHLNIQTESNVENMAEIKKNEEEYKKARGEAIKDIKANHKEEFVIVDMANESMNY